MARNNENTTEKAAQETVIRAKDWVRHTLLKYEMKMEDTAGLSQKDAEQMLEDCREEKRRRAERPATEAQKAELAKLGIAAGEGMTAKEASDAMRDHFRRQAPPMTEAQQKWLLAHHIKEDIVTKAEASRAIARYIAREEIPMYKPPKDGKLSPKDIYLAEAKKQYGENNRSFRNYDEIGIIKKMMAEGVTEPTIRSTVSVYSPICAKCTEKQLDYLVELAASDKKVAAKAKERAEEKGNKLRPPTEKQLALMKKKKIEYTEGMSGLQAAALIARKVNFEALQLHKPDLSKESNPQEFYRSFAQAELRKNGWKLERYSDTAAVIAMADRGFTKSVICETLDKNSPKCGKSLESWLDRQVTRTLEKHKRDVTEQARETQKEAAKEVFRDQGNTMAGLGVEVAFEETKARPVETPAMEAAPVQEKEGEKDKPLKYELTNITMGQEGLLIRRIRALRDIPAVGIKAGDYGGYVFSMQNLSQEGNSWVGEDAKVYRDAIVCEDAVVCGKAEVTNKAIVAGSAWVDGESHVQENAVVLDNAVVSGHGVVTGDGLVCEDGFVNGFACVKGNGFVAGKDNGISGKTVVETAAEDLGDYHASLQQTYREAMQSEQGVRGWTASHMIAHVEDQKAITPAMVVRPERPGLEKEEKARKKPVARKRVEGHEEKKQNKRI